MLVKRTRCAMICFDFSSHNCNFKQAMESGGKHTGLLSLLISHITDCRFERFQFSSDMAGILCHKCSTDVPWQDIHLHLPLHTQERIGGLVG